MQRPSEFGQGCCGHVGGTLPDRPCNNQMAVVLPNQDGRLCIRVQRNIDLLQMSALAEGRCRNGLSWEIQGPYRPCVKIEMSRTIRTLPLDL